MSSKIPLTLRIKHNNQTIFILAKQTAKISDVKKQLAEALGDRGSEQLPGLSPPPEQPVEIKIEDIRLALENKPSEWTELTNNKASLESLGIKDGAILGYTTNPASEFSYENPDIQPIEMET